MICRISSIYKVTGYSQTVFVGKELRRFRKSRTYHNISEISQKVAFRNVENRSLRNSELKNQFINQ